MKVILNQLPIKDPEIKKVLLAIATQLNLLSESKLAAKYNAQSAVPTTGTYAVGDFVPNSAPAELGSAGSKYVIEGWVCVTAPTTFVQKRFLTGN